MKITDSHVKEIFINYPKAVREKLMKLRNLIIDTYKNSSHIGELVETTKWGEPSYFPKKSKIGTTIRIDWKKKSPDKYFMFFNCRTTLIEEARANFGDLFKYQGNRAIVFEMDQDIPKAELSEIILWAHTYHMRKNSSKQTP